MSGIIERHGLNIGGAIVGSAVYGCFMGLASAVLFLAAWAGGSIIGAALGSQIGRR